MSISKYLYLIFALAMTILIMWLSSIQNLRIVQDNSRLDAVVSNFAHIPLYALFAYFWGMTFDKMEWKYGSVNPYLIIGLILFSFTDEIHQSFVPGRTASFSDIVLDITGITMGIIAISLIKRRRILE